MTTVERLKKRTEELLQLRVTTLEEKQRTGAAYDLNPTDENLRSHEYARKRYAAAKDAYERAKTKLERNGGTCK